MLMGLDTIGSPLVQSACQEHGNWEEHLVVNLEPDSLLVWYWTSYLTLMGLDFLMC